MPGNLTMSDVFSQEKRSKLMSLILSKDTIPEKRIRSGLHRMGYRFRLHDKKLPGRPDIILPKFKTVIQVRGCFWHGHDDCIDGHIPKSRKEYWEPKLMGNINRDRQNDKKLREIGFNVIVVWECQCMTKKGLEAELLRITRLLSLG
jgi:DNA mismatch endonuclease (patch repair protein)